MTHRPAAPANRCLREQIGFVGCPGGCACLEVPGDAEPHRFIANELPPSRQQRPPTDGLTWQTRIDFCARRLRFTTLADFLEQAFPNEVFVPAAKVHGSMSRRLDGVTLAELACVAGLPRLERR